MTAVVERLGSATVKGLSWSAPGAVQIVGQGVVGDRHWSPVTPELVCIKATDFPAMVGLSATLSEIPRAPQVFYDGIPQTVRYYNRPVTARVFGGPLAEKISEAAGRRLYLACTEGPGHFLWSSPVSVLLRSELGALPNDVDRYRANVVLDDRAQALNLTAGTRLELGDVVLEVERELERCVIINHHAASGERDASLLGQLRPGPVLGYGCNVIRVGTVHLGARVRVVRDRSGHDPH